MDVQIYHAPGRVTILSPLSNLQKEEELHSEKYVVALTTRR